VLVLERLVNGRAATEKVIQVVLL